MFELQWQDVAHRPKKTGSGVMFFKSLSAADFAQLLIHLEALGYRVDPEPLTAQLLPTITKKKLISGAEVSVFWYSRERHRGQPMYVTIDTVPLPPRSKFEEWKTSTGYRLAVMGAEDGAPVQLTAHAPRYRARPAPVRTTCEECGVEYYRGDTDSSASHRKEHKKRMRYMDPKPDARVLEADGSVPSMVLVTTHSPAWLHSEIYDRALAFKREFGYDFVQWGSPRGDDDLNACGVLFVDESGTIVGACAFRLREWNEQRQWALQWVWFAPQHRRQGHLARHWSAFRSEYGDFDVESPVSAAMQAFLAKQGDTRLMGGTELESPEN
ncbi:hypothetical protein G3A43_07525 [Paraburkholderia aspalathi]|nr:GNAT family N-acetyltransferase [Paraburkholderia aspalathi]MBK3780104.1 hypothetical protein [Paraburkholderia aspalathi]